MTGARLSRIGGFLIFIGAIAFVLHVVLRSGLTAGVDPAVSAQAGLWVPVNALGALSAALVLLGLPAVYARMSEQSGLTGLVGFALIGVSWMFFGLFLSLYGALVLPWLADQAPRLVAGSSSTPLGFVLAFAFGLLTWLLGAALFAVPLVRGPARTRWVGYVLPASALWVLVGSFVIAPDGPASNLAVNLLSNLGAGAALDRARLPRLSGVGGARPGQARRAGCRWLTGPRGNRLLLGAGAGWAAAERVRRDRENTLLWGLR